MLEGLARSHIPVLAVSVPLGSVVQPWSVSKSSEKIGPGPGVSVGGGGGVFVGGGGVSVGGGGVSVGGGGGVFVGGGGVSVGGIVPVPVIISVFALIAVVVPIYMPIPAFAFILKTALGFKRVVFFLECNPLKKIDFFILVGIDFSESLNGSP